MLEAKSCLSDPSTAAPPKSGASVAGIFALLVGTVALVWAALAVSQGGVQYALCGLALTLYLVALLLILRTHCGFQLTRFDIGGWVLAFASLSYGLATITISSAQSQRAAAVDPAFTSRACLLLGAGFTAFAIGYAVRVDPVRTLLLTVLRPRFLARREHVAAPAAILGTYGVGVIATVAQIRLLGGFAYIGGSNIGSDSHVASYTQILVIVTSLRTYALFAASMRAARLGTPANRLLVALLFTIEVTIGLLGATKESFVVASLAVLIPMSAVGRRHLPVSRIVAGALVFVVVVTPFVSAFRGELRDQNGRLSAGESLQIGITALTQGGPHDQQTEGKNQLMTVLARLRLVDNEIVILEKTPSLIGYKPAGDLASAPLVGLVPRTLWPDKPLFLSGLDFYKVYYRGEGFSSSAVTFQGSLYLYGGALTALIGMFALGLVLRALDGARVLLTPERSGLIALILFIPVVKQELDVATMLAAIPVYVATFYLSVLLLFRPHAVRQELSS